MNDSPDAARSSARARNAAICPRVTLASGQNRVLAGGLQPRVMPAEAMQLMSFSKVWPLSSSNDSTHSSFGSGGDGGDVPSQAMISKSRVPAVVVSPIRSEEHTPELQSRENLVCRLLLDKPNERQPG